MVHAIENPPEPPQIDSCLPLLTRSTDDLAVSSTSARSSNSTITETKNDDFLHNTDDRSRRFSENNSKHHQAAAEKSNQEPVSDILLQRQFNDFCKLYKQIMFQMSKIEP